MYSAMVGMIDQIRGQRLTLALAVALLVLLSPPLLVPAVAQSAYDCQGETADLVFIGFEGVIVGTDEDEVIYVEGGWNTVDGMLGDDKICVAGHFNTIIGGSGDDEIVGDGLYNELYGEEDDDTLITDSETGFMLGGPGVNSCNGGPC